MQQGECIDCARDPTSCVVSLVENLMEFFHTGALQLDSLLRRSERYAGVSVDRLHDVVRPAFVGFIELATRKAIDFVNLTNGFDDDAWADFGIGFFVNRQCNCVERISGFHRKRKSTTHAREAEQLCSWWQRMLRRKKKREY